MRPDLQVQDAAEGPSEDESRDRAGRDSLSSNRSGNQFDYR